MTGPIIPAGEWPEWADRHCWDEDGDGRFYGQWAAKGMWKSDWSWSNIPMPTGWDWRVPVMRPTCKDSLPVAPAIDLGKLRAFAESVIDRGHRGDCESRHRADNRCDCGMGQTKQEAKDLLALIDGQANVRSSSEHSSALTHVAHKKLQGLQDEGFIVNGVAIFNPTTGRRGLVDYLGYVGWQTSEQPTKGEEE